MKYNEKEVRMLPINPRYTDMGKVDFDNLNFSDYNEIEVAKELLKYEGDLSDLCELIEAIKVNGFLYLNDKILLHYDLQKSNYYVLEGNRRVLSLKLINGEIKLNDILGEKPTFDNVKYEIWGKNKNLISKLIDSMSENVIDENFFEDVSNKSMDIIWKTIYSKHAGEQIGKRNWSRAKYFDDLLKLFSKNKDSGIDFVKNISELSQLFGKKNATIKNDINSAIWIIKSLEIYNKNEEKEVDYRQMEVSGYELLLSQRLLLNGKEKTIRDILGISIDSNNLIFSYDEKMDEQKFEEIIKFLVKNSLEKNITTRGIKDEIYEELGEVLGESLGNKKTLNSAYIELKKKSNSDSLEIIEEKKLELLESIRSNDINPNEFMDEKYDSKFVKSIKYLMRNDLKTISNLKNFDEDEYPFTNVAMTIRTIFDLLILEYFYRMKEKNKEVALKMSVSIGDIQIIENFIDNYGKPEEHDVNKITAVLSSIVISHGASDMASIITNSLEELYINRINELGMNFDEFKSTILQLINFKKNNEDVFNNFKLLNALVHKPYFGFEYKDNVDLIDNLNIMYITVKKALKIFNIWKKVK